MRPPTYRRYLVFLLAIILALNYTDRIALGLVLQNIKGDLHLSDTQLGFLTGLAFALFYATVGIPIGRWVDRGNRVTIVTLTTALWSVLVGITGHATSFLQLLLVRVGVGVGESGCIPPAYSLISDSFSSVERPQALGIYFLGGPASFVVGYFLAGWLNQLYGWRVMFMVIGAPGLVMAALAALTMQESRLVEPTPGSGAREAVTGPSTVRAHTGGATMPPALWPAIRSLYSNPTYRNLLFALALNYLFGYGIMQWQAAFFIRSYGLKTGYLGTWLAFSVGISGLLGSYLGGHWASRHAGNNEPLQLKVQAGLNAGFGLISAFVYLSRDYYLSFFLIAVATAVGMFENGPVFGALQAVVPERVRGMSISVVFLFANLIGVGLGPLAVGILSDSLRPILGTESLRYALVAMGPGYFWGAWHLWRASKRVREDIDAASKQGSEQQQGVAVDLRS